MPYKHPETSKEEMFDAVEKLSEIVMAQYLLPGPSRRINEQIGKLRSLAKHLPEDGTAK